MKLGHYLSELQSAQSSIKEKSQSLSRESLDNGEETFVEKEELNLELGPFRFSRKKEVHRSSTNSIHRKSLEETQSGSVGSYQVLEQREERKALLEGEDPQSQAPEEEFSLWKGVNRVV